MLELVDLSRRFGDVVALDSVSFSVADGEMVGFVGPNGAGKTTAMRIALGVLEPDRGEVRWRGRPVDAAMRRRFGYMPEERGLYPKMRVLDQLVYLARLHGLPKTDALTESRRMTEVLGVAGRARDRTDALSLGNQQRVQLAAALVHRPEVLVLDEAFSGLDPVGVDVLSGVLREQAAAGVPVVFSSHQLDLVERLCESVVLIDRGRIVATGKVSHLRAADPRRLVRVEVAGADPGWYARLSGVRVLDPLPEGAILELSDSVLERDVLDAARVAGDVRLQRGAAITQRDIPEGRAGVNADGDRGAFRLVARREFVERARDRSFIVSTAITLLVLVGFILVNAFLGGETRFDLGVVGEGSRATARAVEVVAPSLGFTVSLETFVSESQANAALRDGSVDAVLVDGRRVLVKSEAPEQLLAVIQVVSARERTARELQAAGLTPEEVERAIDAPPLPVQALEPPDERSEESSVVAFVGVLALYGQLLSYGYWVASGVVEEKASRVVEVLLATIRPTQLLRGKILGIGLLGLCQLLLIGVVGLAVARAAGTLSFPAGALAAMGAVLLWFVLGFFFYSSLFAVAGAIVPRQEDLQTTMTPLTILVLVSFLIGINAVGDPSTMLATVASLLPFSAPLVMPSRMVLGQLSVWQGLLSAGIILGATFALIPLATRMYSNAVLRTGRVRIRDVLRGER